MCVFILDAHDASNVFAWQIDVRLLVAASWELVDQSRT